MGLQQKPAYGKMNMRLGMFSNQRVSLIGRLKPLDGLLVGGNLGPGLPICPGSGDRP